MNENVRNLWEKVRETAVAAGDTAGRYIDAAGRKSRELIGSAKINVTIDRRFRDIGALVYKTHTDPDTSSDGLEDLLAELDLLHEELDAIERERERADTERRQNVCPVCGARRGAGDAFCRSCGHAIR